jgi:hypothetical protein
VVYSARFVGRVHDAAAGNKSVGTAVREQVGDAAVMASGLVGGGTARSVAAGATLIGTGVGLQTGSVKQGALASVLYVGASVMVKTLSSTASAFFGGSCLLE